jgi:hypothetical protein
MQVRKANQEKALILVVQRFGLKMQKKEADTEAKHFQVLPKLWLSNGGNIFKVFTVDKSIAFKSV